MAHQTNYISKSDATFPGVNDSILQDGPIILEVPETMASGDDTQFVFDAAGDSGRPPLAVLVTRHTGGDSTSSASATFAINNGDTLEFQVASNANLPAAKWTDYVLALSGLTNGAATAAQIAAAINGDAFLKTVMVAVAGLTANAVTLFPLGPRAAIKVVGGTAAATLAFPALCSNLNRTYVSQTPVIAGGTGFSWSYVASTRTLTVKNETGGGVNRVAIFIQK